MQQHVIEELAQRYPQLTLAITAGMSTSPIYRAVVLQGMEYGRKADFSYSEADSLECVDTPAGVAEVVFLSIREDFEHCVQALAYRCEPRKVPATMGAVTVRGLINWKKIRTHQQEYLRQGNDKSQWKRELAEFTKDAARYRDTIIVVGEGYYSGLLPQKVGMGNEEWLRASRVIRTHHELTHFVYGKLYPEDRDSLRDEVMADAVGLKAALGQYDKSLAALLLGVEGESYRMGGRLENYVEPAELEAGARRVKKLIEEMDE